MNIRVFLALLLIAAVPLSACSGIETKAEYPTAIGHQNPSTKDPGSIFGEGGLDLFGDRKKTEDTGPGIGVNSFLWRASLDTISFMPVSAADPFGGTILTDWQSPAGNPDERLKVNIYILDRMLRSDGLRVSVFRQVRDASGQWVDAAVTEGTASKLEDTILTRARQMRQAQATTTAR
ncbi:MAG TPA: DUF3576 domain-containing protein [Rhodospirillaceae bacterium]|nr:MAG: hypothetical protein A2018_00530 [Alphaproteobacteria bacterium GWF2_58_20]HAU28693.1 DUF3576 domain-containing protein [Rhodospirillaceae bacterium]